MKKISLAAAGLLALTAAASAQDAREFPAQLVGHAILPAQTLIDAPADAPEALKVSGKFTERGNPSRLTTAPSEDGSELPFAGQPVQGFSGISRIDAERYYVLTDNGFGSKSNSPDAMLFFHVVKPDFKSGSVTVEKTTFLSDPNKVVPFNIVMEGSDTRYLTGADLDIEGFQVIDGKIYIGDEFGPFLIVADAGTGVVEAFHETFLGDQKLMSPDHFALKAGNPDKPASGANIKRSRGYEGFAASMDGKTLYPLLEGPVWDEAAGDYERVDGNFALRLLEWDVASQSWTGKSVLYRLEADDHAIGDFNMIDETRGLVIERDGGQGDAELACKDGETENCFKNPALFKRVYMIDMKGLEDGQPVKKIGYIDLMKMQDFDGIARLGKRDDNTFTFPFVTIENVDRVDEDHIIVANDNNFPFSKGRDTVKVDNNEIVLLKVSEFLKAAAE
ncbi:esterase-like activity of phytase family protein [Roseibium aggregatum]|uniref:Esterase-like activity of phytase family protein n=1 Tax=Roseibium aggregatum TaxID=187304 RepID=A0A939IZG5_9HYPH|nr:esterase-like activity of phytase family protein [Roseibium aggregatum]MBN9670016.1 esterase-like activity of phytase family protein [Roseibium aggregatum]